MTNLLRRFADLATTSWRNGAGRRAEVASGAGWTISYAWIDRTAPFSNFSGYDRTLVLVQGSAVRLDVRGAGSVVLDVRSPMIRFDGGATVRATLVDGPVVVLNVMTLRGSCRHTVRTTDRLPVRGWASVLVGSVPLRDGGGAGPLDVVPARMVDKVPAGATLLEIDVAPEDENPDRSRGDG